MRHVAFFALSLVTGCGSSEDHSAPPGGEASIDATTDTHETPTERLDHEHGHRGAEAEVSLNPRAATPGGAA